MVRPNLRPTLAGVFLFALLFLGYVGSARAQVERDLKRGATVIVRTESANRSGAGILVGRKSADSAQSTRYYILTAAHIPDTETAVRVHAQPESHIAHRARVLQSDASLDVALLEVTIDGSRYQMPSAPTIPYVTPSGPPTPVRVMAHLGAPWREASTHIRASPFGNSRVFHIAYAKDEVDVGSSGGAVFDEGTRLLGMVSQQESKDPQSVRVVNVAALLEAMTRWGVEPNLLVSPASQLFLHLDDPQRIRSLLSSASVDQRGPRGQTPLMLAAQRGLVPTMQLLLGAGASKDLQDEEGDTALFSAGRAAHVDAVTLLLGAGANPNHRNKSGVTPLIATADGLPFNRNRAVVIDLLLRRGADPNAAAQYERTALMSAARAENIEVLPADVRTDVVARLLAGGADPRRRYARAGHDQDGYTALHWTAQSGLRETLQVLVRNGADVDAKDKRGMTPLMLVAAARPYYDHSNIGDKSCWAGPDLGSLKAKLLLDAGASTAVRSNAGDTPRDLALKRDVNTPGAERCRKCMADILAGAKC